MNRAWSLIDVRDVLTFVTSVQVHVASSLEWHEPAKTLHVDLTAINE
jgi:hypothetical protein